MYLNLVETTYNKQKLFGFYFKNFFSPYLNTLPNHGFKMVF